PLLSQLAVRWAGGAFDKNLFARRCARIREHYIDGLYIEAQSPRRRLDYYSFWAWHYYASRANAAGVSPRALPLPNAVRTIQVLECVMPDSGALMTWGRSMSYREAVLTPLVEIALTAQRERDRRLARQSYSNCWNRWRAE